MAKSLVCGVGINDADYKIKKSEMVNGKWKDVWNCPFYYRWLGMLKRCYYEKTQIKQPTYVGCVTCDEWHLFSNFKKWMEVQDWEGKDLDKDLLIEGNKLYSPDTCVFVASLVNRFIIDRGNYRGDLMLGVTLREDGAFRARCQNPFTKKREHLGYFSNELDAHLAWKKRKHELAVQLAESEYVTDERIANILKNKYK